jgi:hypothetical protein
MPAAFHCSRPTSSVASSPGVTCARWLLSCNTAAIHAHDHLLRSNGFLVDGLYIAELPVAKLFELSRHVESSNHLYRNHRGHGIFLRGSFWVRDMEWWCDCVPRPPVRGEYIRTPRRSQVATAAFSRSVHGRHFLVATADLSCSSTEYRMLE